MKNEKLTTQEVDEDFAIYGHSLEFSSKIFTGLNG